ncbi:MAG: PDZ domain-containing protein [bacterium]|nr:PDZ domain-containing protein [bacterium]
MIRTAFLILCLTILVVPTTAGAQMAIRLDPEKDLMLPEIGAIAGVQEGADVVSFGTVLPRMARPEKYRDLDVREGDTVLMMNGERIRDVATLRELYDALAVGGEVKLGLRRGAERLLVTFAKIDPAEMAVGGPGEHRIMRRIPMDGGDGDVEMLAEFDALVGERDGRLRVVAKIAPSDLRQGDVVTAINGKTLSSLAEFRELYGAVEIGEPLRFDVLRDGRAIEHTATKVEAGQGLVVRRHH